MTTKVYVDKARLLGRVIIISWVSLILCFVVKIFGGNFFDIVSNNENYKALCEYAQTNVWLEFILAFVSSFICQTFYLLAIIQKYNFTLKEWVFVVASVAINLLSKYISATLGIVFDFYLTIFMPMCFLRKDFKKYIYIVVGILSTLAFQFLSLLVRNLAIKPVDDSIFITLIYMIDMYVMCLLYYLYRNLTKERKTMGKFWVFFAGKSEEKLRKMRDKREAKIAKLEAEKNAIEVELSKRKNEK